LRLHSRQVCPPSLLEGREPILANQLTVEHTFDQSWGDDLEESTDMHTNPAQLAGQLPARTPHAKPGNARATWKPCTLDVLTTQAIAATVRTDGTSDLCDYHGVDIIALVDETLSYTQAQRSTVFGNGNFQRLASGTSLLETPGPSSRPTAPTPP
jgi:hypothetical protein